jgi:hypothetical protein
MGRLVVKGDSMICLCRFSGLESHHGEIRDVTPSYANSTSHEERREHDMGANHHVWAAACL